MSLLIAGLAVLVIIAAIASLVNRRHEDAPGAASLPSAADDDAIDYAELEQAEREVRGLEGDAKGGASDDVVGDDWGPGSAKGPFA